MPLMITSQTLSHIEITPPTSLIVPGCGESLSLTSQASKEDTLSTYPTVSGILPSNAITESKSQAAPIFPPTTASIAERVHAFNLLATPNQPEASSIPPQIVGKRRLFFQPDWFTKFSWLHYEPSVSGVICHICARFSNKGLLLMARCTEPVFLYEGFRNWKKALEKFAAHQLSSTHLIAIEKMQHSCSLPINTQLSLHVSKNQSEARTCLRVIFSSVRFLLRQGLPLRGHETDTGNFKQLLKLRSENVSELSVWMEKKTNFTHADIQNEIATMFAHQILRDLCRIVAATSCFAVIVDGTQDISGQEQQSICIRYVDADLQPNECFMGLYTVDSTKGADLAFMVKDALIRLQLPIERLRGQTYDGAANMAGRYNGCQAVISQSQPLALYTHCGAHCVNLVAQGTCDECTDVSNAIQQVNEFGVLCSNSGKFRQKFASFAETDGPVQAIRPLCPTRWLMRAPMLQHAISQYDIILSCLQEVSEQKDCIAARAGNLLKGFQQGTTYLCLKLSIVVVEKLHCFNRALQARSTTVAGMIEACNQVITSLEKDRSEDQFLHIFNQCTTFIQDHDLDAVTLPRKRAPPKRFTGASEAHHPNSVQDYYKVIFYQLIDYATMQLRQRFHDNGDLRQYQLIENVLLTGEGVDNLRHYPELKLELLSAQLKIFHDNHVDLKHSNVAQVRLTG